MECLQVWQSTVNDWLDLFAEKPEAVSQVLLIQDRMNRGQPLATWEQNCLTAYEQINQANAA